MLFHLFLRFVSLFRFIKSNSYTCVYVLIFDVSKYIRLIDTLRLWWFIIARWCSSTSGQYACYKNNKIKLVNRGISDHSSRGIVNVRLTDRWPLLHVKAAMDWLASSSWHQRRGDLPLHRRQSVDVNVGVSFFFSRNVFKTFAMSRTWTNLHRYWVEKPRVKS